MAARAHERERCPMMFLPLSFAAAAVFLTILWPDGAWAAEAGEVHHKSFSMKEELFKLFNLLIVIAIVYKMAAKPLRKFLADRREGIKKDLEDSEAGRLEAERLLKEQRDKVADLEAELERVRKKGVREVIELRHRLETDQEAQVERLLEQTRNAIGLEAKKAMAEIQNKASEMSLAMAEDILKKGITAEDQGRLTEAYLARLDSVNGGAKWRGATPRPSSGSPRSAAFWTRPGRTSRNSRTRCWTTPGSGEFWRIPAFRGRRGRASSRASSNLRGRAPSCASSYGW